MNRGRYCDWQYSEHKPEDAVHMLLTRDMHIPCGTRVQAFGRQLSAVYISCHLLTQSSTICEHEAVVPLEACWALHHNLPGQKLTESMTLVKYTGIVLLHLWCCIAHKVM